MVEMKEEEKKLVCQSLKDEEKDQVGLVGWH